MIVGRHADPGLATNVLDRHAGIGLFQCGFDLAFAETRRLHANS